MKKIALTQGEFALVDDSDYEWINQWKWYLNKRGKSRYAKRGVWKNNKVGYISMHRLILNAPIGVCVDHVDNNGINNQRHNIRLCTYQQNCFNRISNNKYKGVTNRWKTKKYESSIKFNGKLIHLGTFATPEEAAIAYNEMAIKLFGDFAKLNALI